jgi:RNA polymerase sigma factor (TIGR02999 family)
VNTPSPNNVTQLLKAWRQGDQIARDKLLSMVYPDLRRRAGLLMRRERSNHTLQPTALINEAYIRLVGESDTNWESREHFFKFATKIMRQLLVDYARTRAAEKRGGSRQKLSLDDVGLATKEKDIDLLALDEALTQFEKVDPQRSEVVELRFFGGFSNEEVAELTQRSTATVKRYLRTALAWLRDKIENG